MVLIVVVPGIALAGIWVCPELKVRSWPRNRSVRSGRVCTVRSRYYTFMVIEYGPFTERLEA